MPKQVKQPFIRGVALQRATKLADAIYKYLVRNYKVVGTGKEAQVSVPLKNIFRDKDLQRLKVIFTPKRGPGGASAIYSPRAKVDGIVVFDVPLELGKEYLLNPKNWHHYAGFLVHELIHHIQYLDEKHPINFDNKKLEYLDQPWEIEAHSLQSVYMIIKRSGGVEATLKKYPSLKRFIAEAGRYLEGDYGVDENEAFDLGSKGKVRLNDQEKQRVRAVVAVLNEAYKDLRELATSPQFRSPEYLWYKYVGLKGKVFQQRGLKYRVGKDVYFGLIIPDVLKKLKVRMMLPNHNKVVIKITREEAQALIKNSRKQRII